MEPVALADLTLRELLERLAQRTPAPGGGSAAAIACALAAALAEMAAAYELAAGEGAAADAGRDVGHDPGGDVTRARAARERALALAERDLDAYAPVLAALARPGDDPGRPEALASALRGAAEVPLQIAALAAETAELGAALAGRAGRHVVGDAVAATVLAEAACRTAVRLAALNVGQTRNDVGLDAAGALIARSARARSRALTHGTEV
jgi:formiminotetrahydrofolate cyclodeaminase